MPAIATIPRIPSRMYSAIAGLQWHPWDCEGIFKNTLRILIPRIPHNPKNTLRAISSITHERQAACLRARAQRNLRVAVHALTRNWHVVLQHACMLTRRRAAQYVSLRSDNHRMLFVCARTFSRVGVLQVRMPLFNSEKPTEFIPEQVQLIGEEPPEGYENPIDDDLEEETIRRLNDNWDNQVNPFQ